jgi:hypothetical protein
VRLVLEYAFAGRDVDYVALRLGRFFNTTAAHKRKEFPAKDERDERVD